MRSAGTATSWADPHLSSQILSYMIDEDRPTFERSPTVRWNDAFVKTCAKALSHLKAGDMPGGAGAPSVSEPLGCPGRGGRGNGG